MEQSYTADQVTPVDFKVRRDENKVIVTWKDGHVSHFDSTGLRKHCPCATCNSARQTQRASTTLLPILSRDPGTGPPRIVSAQLVGRYAIQFTWSDGHSTGIYDFRFLRSLDPL